MLRCPESSPSTGSYRHYMRDHLVSIRGVYDDSKVSVGSAEFSPFGDTYSDAMPSGIEMRYTLHQRDAMTGLYYAPYRYYNATTSRWLKRDPLGMVDGPNVYAYVTDNPVGKLDRLGLAGRVHDTNSRGGCPRGWKKYKGDTGYYCWQDAKKTKCGKEYAGNQASCYDDAEEAFCEDNNPYPDQISDNVWEEMVGAIDLAGDIAEAIPYNRKLNEYASETSTCLAVAKAVGMACVADEFK